MANLMQDILRLASELGQCIARHERFVKLRSTEDAVQSDKEAGSLLESLERQRQKIAQLEAELKPVSPAAKHELHRLADAVHTHPKLQDLVKAQADYMEMMNKINEAIRGEIDRSSPSRSA